jgi:NAD+ kinase
MHRKFNTIGLVVRKDVQSHLETIRQVIAIIEKRADVIIHYLQRDAVEGLLPGVTMDNLVNGADLIISLGGDGTILSTARAIVDSSKPLLGVNLGRLGFLADVPILEFEQHLNGIFEGKYSVEQRFFIEGTFMRNNEVIATNIAFNDIIVHAHKSLSMIDYEVFSNGDLIHRQRADGVIVATPTGSTAYALSGGGPIMHPSLQTLAIVPICPHTLSNRPIVVPADQVIEINLSKSTTLGKVNYDGQSTQIMKNNNRVKIRQYPRTITLLHPHNYDYFQILRAKLNWSKNH